MKKQSTLVIVKKDDKVLLGYKKRGFGAGKWNGFGGKLEEGESLVESAHRETYEEAKINLIDLRQVAQFDFKIDDVPELLEVHVFLSTGIVGEPMETDEMRPQWFEIKNIPFPWMWPDDIYWLNRVLEGEKLKGRFTLAGDAVTEYKIEQAEF